MTNEIPDRILRLAAAMRGPEGLTELQLGARFGDPADVEVAAGQVWRARWDTTTRLVLILNLNGRTVLCAPVSIEPPGEDEQSLVLAPHRSIFGVETTLWAGLARSIPLGTLDRLLDMWSLDVVEWCRTVMAGASAPMPEGARMGVRQSSIWEASATTQAVMSDDLDRLAAAPLVPSAEPESTADLRRVLPGIRLSDVQQALGVPQPDAMQILRGKKILTSDQLTVLAELTSVPVETIAATMKPLPLELASELEHPRRRRRWQAMAGRFGGSEAAARLAAGYGVYAMAARQTGSFVPNWRDRLDRWLAAEPPDPATGDRETVD